MIDEVATSTRSIPLPLPSWSIIWMVWEPDKAAYLAYTGRSDWPRNPDGKINIMIRLLGLALLRDWTFHREGSRHRTQARETVVRGCTDWRGENGSVTIYNGTDFSSLLAHADKVIVWGNRNSEDHTQAALNTLPIPCSLRSEPYHHGYRFVGQKL